MMVEDNYHKVNSKLNVLSTVIVAAIDVEVVPIMFPT